MTPDQLTHLDAFNLFCGDLIGSGIHRQVFECRIRKEYVVKVERAEEWRSFANVKEMQFWCDHQYASQIADWLAPCEYLSPDGRIMLQKRTTDISQPDRDKLPLEMPTFLTDIKIENFGWLDGKLVCRDYAATIPNPSLRRRKVNWGYGQ